LEDLLLFGYISFLFCGHVSSLTFLPCSPLLHNRKGSIPLPVSPKAISTRKIVPATPCLVMRLNVSWILMTRMLPMCLKWSITKYIYYGIDSYSLRPSDLRVTRMTELCICFFLSFLIRVRALSFQGYCCLPNRIMNTIH
jgi:hypothetical protein